MRLETRICVLLALLTLAVYWPVTQFDFINYDDPFYVVHNPAIQNGITARAVAWALDSTYMTAWHPLTWVSHMADWQLYGPKPGGHHLTSLLLHVTNVLLLFLLLRKFTGAIWRSAMVAALFAWHPLAVEPVAWISERKGVLSTFFWLLTLAAYARYTIATKSTGLAVRAKVYYGLALFLFALALMSKSMVVTLPCVLLLLDYWPFNRIRFSSSTPSEGQVSLVRAIIEKIPFLALAAIACFTTIHAQVINSDMLTTTVLPLSDRIANGLISYVLYLFKAFWPNDLAVFYPYTQAQSIWVFAGAFALLATITVAVCWFGRQRRYLASGWFWFLGTLMPVIGFVPVATHSMADRYAYIPLIGIFIMLAWSVPELSYRRSNLAAGLKIAAGIVLLACLGATWRQVHYWRNSVSLFSHTVEITPDNIKAEYIFGLALSDDHQNQPAMAHFRKAINLVPSPLEAHFNSQWKAHYHLALLLVQSAQWEEAEAHFRIAARDRPAVAEIEWADQHNNMGSVLWELGRLEEAAAEYRAALQIHPANSLLLENLAGVLAEQQHYGEAITNFALALSHDSGNAAAHNFYGRVLAAAGRPAEAEAQYRQALVIRPNYAEVLVNLGNLLQDQNRLAEAKSQFSQALFIEPTLPKQFAATAQSYVSHGRIRPAIYFFRAALRLNPDELEALNGLAWLLATHREPTIRNGTEALRLAEHANDLTGQSDAIFLATLDAAYAEAGLMDKAIATAEKTEKIARSQGLSAVAEAAQKRLDLYRAGHQYHEH